MPTDTTATPKPRKRPQDRQPKRQPDVNGQQSHLTVTIDGVTYTSTNPIAKSVTFGIMRRYGDNEGLMAVRIIEKAFSDQPDAMDALDELNQEEVGEIGAEMFALYERDQGLSVGEASRSSG